MLGFAVDSVNFEECLPEVLPIFFDDAHFYRRCCQNSERVLGFAGDRVNFDECLPDVLQFFVI